MSILGSVKGPADLKALPAGQLPDLAEEIRRALVGAVARTGGHLGSNLGVVELTIAVHRVFNSPHDPVIFDVGHQSYVHKMLTGRQGGFDRLRHGGGLSGYPARAESAHDVVENSHASVALSWADGIAQAFRLRGEHDRTVVAVVGDGALTGGPAWEALNNIAAHHHEKLVIIVNDNGRSYSPTIGGLAAHLAALRLAPGFDHALSAVRTTLEHTPLIGPAGAQRLASVKRGLKDVIAPQVLFEDLGIKYVGPIDGHDEQAVEKALRLARRYGRPVIVHCLTQKGHGYLPAELDSEDRLHGPGPFDPETGVPVGRPVTTWTDVFGQELVRLGHEQPEVVAVTAAMLHPLGLAPFAAAFPERLVDVGIAEGHAAASAAGLAYGGLHPVVVLYSTFLNRAFDQLLMDIGLHNCPVTFVLDRAGITGPDGPSHHGMWDLSLLQTVPNFRVAAPRDATRLRQQLREALGHQGPTALRYPKGAVPPETPAIGGVGRCDVLFEHPSGVSPPDVLLIGVGPMAATAVESARSLAEHGVSVAVVDPCWAHPLDPELVALAGAVQLVAVIEDHGRVGGVSDAVTRALADSGRPVPVQAHALPQAYIPHDSRDRLLQAFGLDASSVARAVMAALGPVRAAR